MITIIVLVGMVLFGLLHSLAAGKTIKNRVRQRIGALAYDGLYRPGYNVFAAISLARPSGKRTVCLLRCFAYYRSWDWLPPLEMPIAPTAAVSVVVPTIQAEVRTAFKQSSG